MIKNNEITLTEINFLKLPIFKASNQNITDKQPAIVIFADNRTEIIIKASNYGMLNSFDRKIFLAFEHLYLKQNPNFEKNEVIATPRDIINLLNISSKHTENIWGSLSKLQEAEITKKENDGSITRGKQQFNLLYSIGAWTNNRNKKTEEEQKKLRRYDNRISVTFNDWHINNLKNKFYRIINIELVKNLQTDIAVRLFDYLNLNAFYYDNKTKRYKQKTILKIDYIDLVKYLHITEQKELKLIKRQFSKSLQELKDNEVILESDFEKDIFNNFYIILYLSKNINVWGKFNNGDTKDNLINKMLDEIKDFNINPMLNKLVGLGLSNNQSENILENKDIKYIEDKINQYLFMKNNYPDKIKKDRSYLYNSIMDNWQEDLYYNSLNNKNKELLKKQQEKNKESQKILDKLKMEYDKYITDYCNNIYDNMPNKEREQIEKEIEQELNTPFLRDNKNAFNIAFEHKKVEIITKLNKDIMTFDEFKTKHN